MHMIDFKHSQTEGAHGLCKMLSSLKGVVHPKMKILSSFTHPCVIPNLSSVEQKEDILKNVDNQRVDGSH